MKFSIVIPSKNPDNCVACVHSILDREPELPPERIIVVDDGAREGAVERLRRPVTWVTGEKPFVFARNINLGARIAFYQQQADGVVLMNDDTRLLTRYGFSTLADVASVAQERGWITRPAGVVSAALTADVGNRKQLSQIWRGAECPQMIRTEERVLAFVCVYIPRAAWDAVGELDEAYVDYGWDDNDYCKRVTDAGRELFIAEHCLVEHGELPSTFRPGNGAINIINRSAHAYYKKFGDLQGVRIPPEWKHAS
jgi:GT2 family glycosyltransferase